MVAAKTPTETSSSTMPAMKARIVQINLDKLRTLAALDDPPPGQEKALLDNLADLNRVQANCGLIQDQYQSLF